MKRFGEADTLLAEEAILRRDRRRATLLARRALKQENLPQNFKLRALDILSELNATPPNIQTTQ